MVSEKETLAEHLALRDDQFAIEVLRGKVLEADFTWVLQKSVVRVVDRVVESSEFMLAKLLCEAHMCSYWYREGKVDGMSVVGWQQS